MKNAVKAKLNEIPCHFCSSRSVKKEKINIIKTKYIMCEGWGYTSF